MADNRPSSDDTAREYGQYVAIAVINIDGVRAFNPGDPVPASTVKANPEWQKPTDPGDSPLVAGVKTKAAEQAVEV